MLPTPNCEIMIHSSSAFSDCEDDIPRGLRVGWKQEDGFSFPFPATVISNPIIQYIWEDVNETHNNNANMNKWWMEFYICVLHIVCITVLYQYMRKTEWNWREWWGNERERETQRQGENTKMAESVEEREVREGGKKKQWWREGEGKITISATTP